MAPKEGVSASTVSRIIKQLEDSLGQQLFYRNTRAVTPTQAGHVFNALCKNLITEKHECSTAGTSTDRTLEPGGLIRSDAPIFFGQRHIAPSAAAA